MEISQRQELPILNRGKNSRPTAFFQKLYQTFKKAEEATGDPIERSYSIGGFTVKLRFAGRALVPFLTPALGHLENQSTTAPAVTICLWDSVSTGTDMPFPPWSQEDYLARGEIRGYNDDRVYTNFNLGSGILNMLDIQQNTALYWIRDARKLPYYECGAPLLTVLNWWMGRHGRQIIHAGAVGTPQGGVLLVGKGGSGKSLTALTCLNSQLLYAGDDYCLITMNSTPFVYSLFCTGKVNPTDTKKISFLDEALSNAERLDSEKALFFFQGRFSEKLITGFPIKALLLPRITGLSETRVKRTSASAGLTALAPSTIFQLPGAGSNVLQTLSFFVKQVPTYKLELGTDMTHIKKTLEDFLVEQGV